MRGGDRRESCKRQLQVNPREVLLFGTHLIFPEQKYTKAPARFCPQAGVEMKGGWVERNVEMLNWQTKTFSFYSVREKEYHKDFYYIIIQCDPHFKNFLLWKISNIYENRIVEWTPMNSPSGFNNYQFVVNLVLSLPVPGLFWRKPRHFFSSINIAECTSKS